MQAVLADVDLATTIASHLLGPWWCTARAPGRVTEPDQLNEDHGDWVPATVPGTVAAALDASGRWDLRRPTDLDANDWWFRTTFDRPVQTGTRPCQLFFGGLATLAEIWLNGQKLLTTGNMFRSYRIDIAPHLEAENELVLGFRSLTEQLNRKRPRPRWKTNLVRNQQLRWYRCSLIGRIPGWAPCAPAIGPWRDVRLESAPVLLEAVSLTPALVGTTGVVSLHAKIAAEVEPCAAALRVGEFESSLELQPAGDGWTISGAVQIPNAPLWWPHTHGSPVLLECSIRINLGGETHDLACSPIGFRRLQVRAGDDFAIQINGEPVFCRGACWTVSDLLSPGRNDQTLLRHSLQLAKDAGANMLRIGGTMHYESDSFYRLCDELGLLVWQDFMFANMDYPVDDASFLENITAEATEQLTRLSRHPSVVVYCGNSEIEQQAAMLGLSRDRWTNDWFARILPELCSIHHPGTAYVPSTPTGGALPFHTNTGISHYYGVGAYRRSPSELRQADVKFTPECLGFANIPEPSTIYAVTGGSHPVMHDPVWKQRVPRDSGAGWDFEDVRDHYLRETYAVDPAELRSFDMPRYLELSRAVSGEMMARAFSEWRSTHSRNRGALVWFYQDLWPGAGWGIVDSYGLPKAAYYYLKRSWRSRQLTLTDEGLNGLDVHLTNELSQPYGGILEVALLKQPNIVVSRKEIAVQLAARSQKRFGVDELLERFSDVTYAYRFGPPQHDLVCATWFNESRGVVSEAVQFVRRTIGRTATVKTISAVARQTGETTYQLDLKSDQFLDTVRVEADGYVPDENYFHLMPNRPKAVTFHRTGKSSGVFRAVIQALNLDSDTSIAVTNGSF